MDTLGALIMCLFAVALCAWGFLVQFAPTDGTGEPVYTPELMGPDPDAEWRAIERVTGMDVYM